MMKEADWTKVKTELESISGESDQLKGRQEHINSEVKKIKNIVRLHQVKFDIAYVILGIKWWCSVTSKNVDITVTYKFKAK